MRRDNRMAWDIDKDSLPPYKHYPNLESPDWGNHICNVEEGYTDYRNKSIVGGMSTLTLSWDICGTSHPNEGA